MNKETKMCSKVCWDLLELTEQQAGLISKLVVRVKELESILEVE